MRFFLSDLQRSDVETERGDRLGHLFDVKVAKGDTGAPPTLQALLVGRGGLARRLGVARTRSRQVPVEEIVSFEEGTVVIRSR